MTFKSLTIISILLLFQINLVAQDARGISEKAKDLMEIKAMEMLATLTIIDAKGRERVRKTSTATKKFGETTKTIIKFLSPPDVKGIGMLIYDYNVKNDDMWIYLPALRKMRRIISSEKSKSFMGSEFSNADMSSPNLDDFKYKLLGYELINDKECWKIETICNDVDIEDMYGFSKKISFIEKSTNLVLKVDYYDLYKELHKTLLIDNYKKQSNNKYFAFSMKMENIQNGRKSIMLIDKFQQGSSLLENYFAPAMLGK